MPRVTVNVNQRKTQKNNSKVIAAKRKNKKMLTSGEIRSAFRKSMARKAALSRYNANDARVYSAVSSMVAEAVANQ